MNDQSHDKNLISTKNSFPNVKKLHPQKNATEIFFRKDIENEFHIKRSTVSQLLTLMGKNGLIERHSVEYDARLKKIVLTEKAKHIHNGVEESLSEVEKKITDSLTDEETDTFFRLLDKIEQNLQ